MFSIEASICLWKLFSPQQNVWGIVLFFENQCGNFLFLRHTICGNFFILRQTSIWENCDAWNLIFLRYSIVFIHKFCDKMSSRNIPDPNEHNQQLLARLWDATKWRVDGKCYCPCTQCRGFKRRMILISTTTKHCREHGHAEGGNEYHPFVSLAW